MELTWPPKFSEIRYRLLKPDLQQGAILFQANETPLEWYRRADIALNICLALITPGLTNSRSSSWASKFAFPNYTCVRLVRECYFTEMREILL